VMTGAMTGAMTGVMTGWPKDVQGSRGQRFGARDLVTRRHRVSLIAQK
jgi:hypothetical protein